LVAKESVFQGELIRELKSMFPGCLVLKNDSGYIQGIPDLLILFNGQWAALECKRGSGSTRRPNQAYYIDKMDEMSFARFIHPDNKEDVLSGLQQAFLP